MKTNIRGSQSRIRLKNYEEVHPSSSEELSSDKLRDIQGGVAKVHFCRAIIEKEYNLDEGTIEESEYCLAVPLGRKWNGHLFLYCHGARPTGIELTADLNLYDDFYNQLILEGWIVGNLSYRRGGVIINDAILDINNLREYVIKKYGEIEFAILEGESMGGHIVTLVAERHPDLYHAVFTVGAALCPTKQGSSFPNDDEEFIKFTHDVKIPSIFLTNFTETSYIERYISNVPSTSKYKPKMWACVRPGHCNVNTHERNHVFLAVVNWAKNGIEPPEENDDITFFVESKPSEVIFDNPEKPHLGGAWGKFFTYNVYGDIETNFQEDDINKLGIRPGFLHKIKITFKIDDYVNKVYEGFLGTSGDAFDVNVPSQEWMVWIHANGYAILCKNNSLTEVTSAVSYVKFSPGTQIHLQYKSAPLKTGK